MRIGFTERGDAGLDLSWHEKVRERNCDGLIAITKNLTMGCTEKLLDLHFSGFPIILHAGVTGLPKSIERCTPELETSMFRIANLVDMGFPMERIVLRVDPIIPVAPYLDCVDGVLKAAVEEGLLSKDGPSVRVRVSVLDNYPHVRDRFARELGPDAVLYNSMFQPPVYAFRDLTDRLEPWVADGYVSRFETCAETNLCDPDVFEAVGCLSVKDLEAMGLDPTQAPASVNGQNRHGCLCLTCKEELLTHRHPCANKCLYCYWKD